MLTPADRESLKLKTSKMYHGIPARVERGSAVEGRVRAEVWAQRFGDMVARLHEGDNQELKQSLLHIHAIIHNNPDIVDTVAMRTEDMVNEDAVVQLQYEGTPQDQAFLIEQASPVRSGNTTLVETAQEHAVEDILRSFSTKRDDGTYLVRLQPGVPVSCDGLRYRAFSEEARRLPPLEQVALKVEAIRRPEPIAAFTEQRIGWLTFTSCANDHMRRRRWVPETEDLDAPAQPCPPHLLDDEYNKIRMILHVFARKGEADVVRTIEALLRYRFHDHCLIERFLRAGLLDSNDTVYTKDGAKDGFKGEYRSRPRLPKGKRLQGKRRRSGSPIQPFADAVLVP
ncbi:hypothetical protein DFH06DRAFT_1195670 [Mycena polygramma]|nr:hypothetical protein DFH06DRAFT_1195670 [Mycena polygramma]